MRQPFDETIKTFLRRLFESWGLAAVTQLEVFSRGRFIDLVTWCVTSEDRAHVRGTVFERFRRLNALEFKGPQDALNLGDYNLIMLRAWALGGIKLRAPGPGDEGAPAAGTAPAELPGERAVFIICVRRPDHILDDLREELRFLRTEEAGIYLCNERLQQWIIYPTELELAPRNYPLLPLARGEKLKQFIDVCVRDGLTDYLQLVLDVGLETDPITVWQKILEVREMRVALPEETWKDIDEFLRLTPEVREKLSWVQELVDDSEERGEEHGRLDERRQTLLRQMRRKFGGVPEAVVRRVETTEDSERLGEWLDRVVEAGSLAEMGFGDLE